MDQPTVEIESKSLSISNARICSVFIHREMPGDVDVGNATIVIQDAAVARISYHAFEENGIVEVVLRRLTVAY